MTEVQAQPSITCPVCWMRSFHPMDVKEGYCGRCHAFTAEYSSEELELAVRALHVQVDGVCVYCSSRAERPMVWPCHAFAVLGVDV